MSDKDHDWMKIADLEEEEGTDEFFKNTFVTLFLVLIAAPVIVSVGVITYLLLFPGE